MTKYHVPPLKPMILQCVSRFEGMRAINRNALGFKPPKRSYPASSVSRVPLAVRVGRLQDSTTLPVLG